MKESTEKSSGDLFGEEMRMDRGGGQVELVLECALYAILSSLQHSLVLYNKFYLFSPHSLDGDTKSPRGYIARFKSHPLGSNGAVFELESRVRAYAHCVSAKGQRRVLRP